ncbi:hypothetical protein Tco_0464066 [Tanacetum coccineum]
MSCGLGLCFLERRWLEIEKPHYQMSGKKMMFFWMYCSKTLRLYVINHSIDSLCPLLLLRSHCHGLIDCPSRRKKGPPNTCGLDLYLDPNNSTQGHPIVIGVFVPILPFFSKLSLDEDSKCLKLSISFVGLLGTDPAKMHHHEEKVPHHNDESEKLSFCRTLSTFDFGWI